MLHVWRHVQLRIIEYRLNEGGTRTNLGHTEWQIMRLNQKILMWKYQEQIPTSEHCPIIKPNIITLIKLWSWNKVSGVILQLFTMSLNPKGIPASLGMTSVSCTASKPAIECWLVLVSESYCGFLCVHLAVAVSSRKKGTGESWYTDSFILTWPQGIFRVHKKPRRLFWAPQVSCTLADQLINFSQ